MKTEVYVIVGMTGGNPWIYRINGEPKVFFAKREASWYLRLESPAERKANKMRVVKATLSVEDGE